MPAGASEDFLFCAVEIDSLLLLLLCGPPPYEGAAYCVALCLSVRLSVRPVIVTERHVAPPSELQ